jgi:hypothetical protein
MKPQKLQHKQLAVVLIRVFFVVPGMAKNALSNFAYLKTRKFVAEGGYL